MTKHPSPNNHSPNIYIIYIYFLQQQYQSALFWADKVASLSHGECPECQHCVRLQ